MSAEPRYLLIVACSQRKRSDPGLLPAIERYDGGTFRLLRKARREGHWPVGLDVLVLSANYGLINVSAPIACYEQRMTHTRAGELRDRFREVLSSYTAQQRYRSVYVDLGQDYLPVIGGLVDLVNSPSLTLAQGRIGERLAKLRNWLVTRSEE